MAQAAAIRTVRLMTTTVLPGAERRRPWRRIELSAWAAVALVTIVAFVALVELTNVNPVVAFLGIVVALDLPICLDIIWRAGRDQGPDR